MAMLKQRTSEHKTDTRRGSVVLGLGKLWGPTPLEQRLRTAAILQARGALAGKDTLNPVAWQRGIRALDRRRERTLNRLRGKTARKSPRGRKRVRSR